MNAPRWLLASLLATAVCGCRSGGMEMAEQELRTQEDRIYQLQEYIEKYQAMLASCRRENESLRRELGMQGDVERPPAGSRSAPRGSSVVPPRGGSAPPDDSEFRPPVIEQGEPTTPSAPVLPGPEGELILPGPEESSGAAPELPVAQLALNPRLTGGLDMDGHPGDDGVLVVVEPRTADGQLTRATGEVSIMLVDPTREGPESRIARWDFSADEAAQSWKKTFVGQGMQFQLPWPTEAPRAGKLRLFARLVTPQGEKFLAEKDIAVDITGAAPAGKHSAEWTSSQRAKALGVVRTSHEEPLAAKGATGAGSRRGQWQLRSLDEPVADEDIAPHDGEHPAALRTEAHRGSRSWRPYR
jgi:hypothetical protein